MLFALMTKLEIDEIPDSLLTLPDNISILYLTGRSEKRESLLEKTYSDVQSGD